jgi:hypothetical protein
MKQALTFFLILLGLQSYAQLSQQARFEKPQKSSEEEFTIISLEEEGIALFRETDKYKDGKHSWQVILLDTALQQKVDTLITIDREYSILGYEYVSSKLNLLFQVGDFVKKKLILCSVDLQNLIIAQIEIKTELDIALTHFNSMGSTILLGGYISGEPTIVIYEINKANITVVPGFLQRNTELLDMRVNENNTFNVILAERVSGENKHLVFRTFDSKGKLLLEDIILQDNSYTLQTALSSSLHQDDLIVFGTWGTRNSNRAYGFFSTMINPFEDQKVTHTAFGQLNHYLDYVRPKLAQKIKTKTKEAITKKKLYDYSNAVMPYKIIEHEKGFLALAETHSPTSQSLPAYYKNPSAPNSNNPYYNSNPYFNAYPTSRLYSPPFYSTTVADDQEIKVYSSSVLLFNTKGEIINDYSVKLKDIKLSSVRQVTDVNFYDGIITFLYKKENKIYFKEIDPANDEVIEGEDLIKMKHALDEFREEEEGYGGVKNWYSKFFFIWGHQTIKNMKEEKDMMRRVFCINKIAILH